MNHRVSVKTVIKGRQLVQGWKMFGNERKGRINVVPGSSGSANSVFIATVTEVFGITK